MFAASGRFQLLFRSRIEEIGQDRCVIRTLYLAEPQVVPADTVIFINAKEPVRGVYDDLRSHGYQLGGNLAIVGDARAPRDLQFAISEGHRLRSEERRVGKECVSTCRSRWSP